MIVFLLILHGLIGVALLGAITHQAVALLRRTGPRSQSFLASYVGINPRTFSSAVMVLFAVNVVLGGVSLMIRLNRNGVRGTVRPSGHVIRNSFDKIDAGGAIPTNVTEGDLRDVPENMLKMGNNAANDSYTRQCKENGVKIHPARFPALLPKFFIKLLTDANDLVVDPFAGSNTTGAVAESLKRRWIASEAVEEYLKASTFRFEDPKEQTNPCQVALF
jgi:DNA methylase